LKHPDVLKKAYEEVDRVLGPDIDAKPTYQQVTQLTYITQVLKEALRLWPPAPAYGIAPLKDETIADNTTPEEHVCFGPCARIASRPVGVGTEPDAFDPENFSSAAESARPSTLEAVRQRSARLHRRGFAMHEAALANRLMILQRSS